MNKIANFSIILLALTSILSGCNNDANTKERTNQNNVYQSKSGNSNPQKVEVNEAVGSNLNHSFDSSIYYASESNPIINTSDNQITWKEGKVVLTATISKAEGEQASQSNTVISSITVESNNGTYTIQLDKEPLGIQSVSLTKNNQLAVHLRDHEGSRLIILSLSSGKQNVLNNLPHKAAFSEKIDSYNWSPDGKTIAFGIGDIGSSYIALYNTIDNTFADLSEKDFRLITSVVWHKDGKSLDFLSKTDDAKNPAILYRYTLKDKLISKMYDNLTENEQTTLTTKFLPTKISSETSGLTPERRKELDKEVLSTPAAVVHTKQGEFFPVEKPNEYPSDQVANLDLEDIEDNEDIVTSETRQIILKGFYYEKK